MCCIVLKTLLYLLCERGINNQPSRVAMPIQISIAILLALILLRSTLRQQQTRRPAEVVIVEGKAYSLQRENHKRDTLVPMAPRQNGSGQNKNKVIIRGGRNTGFFENIFRHAGLNRFMVTDDQLKEEEKEAASNNYITRNI